MTEMQALKADNDIMRQQLSAIKEIIGKAPSETVDEKWATDADIREIHTTWLDKQAGINFVDAIKLVKKQKPHSQQEKSLSSAQRQRLFDFIADIAGYHLMDDELNQIENIVYPKTYPYTLKDDQQEKRYTLEEVSRLYEQWHSDTGTTPFPIWLSNYEADQFDQEGK